MSSTRAAGTPYLQCGPPKCIYSTENYCIGYCESVLSKLLLCKYLLAVLKLQRS